jgi:hypothetical protein
MAMNYGGCWPVLLLEQAPARELFDWRPGDSDIVFNHTVDTYPEIQLTGAAPATPATLAPGRWAVGLGIGESSDEGGTPNWGTVLCVREFDVLETTRQISVQASFGQPCSIDLELEPESTFEQSTIPVKLWRAPDGGELDDCRYRTLLLRLETDGTIWYEDVASGERVEVGWPEFEGWTIERIGIDEVAVSPDGKLRLAAWSIRGEQCLLQSGGQLWIGDTQAAWYPWDAAFGDDVPIRSIAWSRGDTPAVAPPAAASLTASRAAQPDRALLRAIDREIDRFGVDRWSETAPELYVGGPFDGPGRLSDELGGGGSIHSGSDWWFVSDDLTSARHVRTYRTPAGHLVWSPDETLSGWNDCADLVVPPIYPGPIEPGYETGLDPDGGLMTLVVYEADGDDGTTIVVDITDEACQAHPVIGPMIDHLETT